ncbi:hypothetical protein KJ644_01220 [Candidatus Dependentiae bacterium]|nr:hypothetical protein [Candidatus Dependentiae bacterium]MBU4387071.1 hypothetical protein [Candidatus Dependentiae bacterium]MCG2756223.1 hypothetical protein [Candidatus Dependentiae bacterium]
MKQLEELEVKVLQIVQKNKDLQNKNSELKKENDKLLSKCVQLEQALITKEKTSEGFELEKDLIKDSIKNLLDSISSLEEKNKEVVK